jgi:hypothetical protein
MNKKELESRIEDLRSVVLQSQQQTSNNVGELSRLEKRLEDLDKPKLTSDQIADLEGIITNAVECFIFEEEDFEYEISIDYEQRVAVCGLDYINESCLVEKLVDEVLDYFREDDGEDDIS